MSLICEYQRSFFTARKRSLGQGNIFSSVCQEFCTWGGGSCRFSGGGLVSGYPSMPCRFPGPHPRWSLRGLGDLQAHTGGEVAGSPGPHLGVSPGPHTGGLQAHTGGSPAHTQGSPGPHLGKGVGVSQHSLRQTPPGPPAPQLMATAAGGMHPTGMHSC